MATLEIWNDYMTKVLTKGEIKLGLSWLYITEKMLNILKKYVYISLHKHYVSNFFSDEPVVTLSAKKTRTCSHLHL